MVRLKASIMSSRFNFLAYFNSTMVRLKGCAISTATMQFANFNSTMVRLKDEAIHPRAAIANEFQFHYGSVKSCAHTTMLL